MIKVVTFYKFTPIVPERLESLKLELIAKATELEIKGLLLIGTEGCNSTISGEPEKLELYKQYLMSLSEIGELVFKESTSEVHPFRRFKVDIREEIVTLKDTDAVPKEGKNNHLSPTEWQRVLDSDEDYLLIDTRNTYETEIGVFKGALDMNLKKFSEFPDKVKNLDVPKDKKVLMYCTGGIRCEKAILDMQKQGFSNVYQLDGGILKYLEEYPNRSYEGECFIFDHRVALNQNLEATTRYKLCPHCGNPADKEINCILCETKSVVCKHCLAAQDNLHTCSKNCAYHAKIRNLKPQNPIAL